MTPERERAIQLANRILDRINADSDDDLALLSRQLLRANSAQDRMVSKDELRSTIELLTRLVGHYFEPQIAHYRIVNEIERLQNLLGKKGEK